MMQNKALATLCTLGIGGPAKQYCEVKTIEDLKDALSLKIPFFILGKGSNCLFDDQGINGLVIHNKIAFLKQSGSTFHVGAGYSFSRLGTYTAKLGLSGLEFAAGIPGSVGGALFMNAGANGSETKSCLLSVDYMDENGHLTTYSKEQISFGYRYSSFQEMRGCIVGATFCLNEDKTARARQLDIIHYREKTQPYNAQSAGCAFRNPEGNYAGQLIEACGLKGHTIGSASISSLHANFLINQNNASSKDFKALIQWVQTQVLQTTGTPLECEIRMIPYEL